MPVTSRYLAAALIALQAFSSVRADLYMHHPPGSNDRNRERNENRNNANRMFNSQNNAKGGYPWAGDRELQGMWDGLKWYAESDLRIEWTLQHAAGPNADVDAQLIFQYSCDSAPGGSDAQWASASGDPMAYAYAHLGGPFIRDGYPTGPLEDADNNNAGQYKRASFHTTNTGTNNQNADGTNTIPCAAGVGAQGCNPPNFNDNLMDTDPTHYNSFYNGTTAVQGTTDTWYPLEWGYHEQFYWFRDFCLNRLRNMYLYTADQALGTSATHTRQNPNGDRHGFECQEERDYYPWWNPSPWVDIAILVDNQAKCGYYQSHSQNTVPRYYCKANDPTVNKFMPLFGADICKNANGTWTTWPAWNNFESTLTQPDCQLHPFSRDNHLGNVIATDGGMPITAAYIWNIPKYLANKKCVLRMRYNMSSTDYPENNFQVADGTTFTAHYNYGDSVEAPVNEWNRFWSGAPRTNQQYDGMNCPNNIDTLAKAKPVGSTPDTTIGPFCRNILNGTYTSAGINRPYVAITSDPTNPLLSIAFNTDQVSRTFQDRSYVFQVMDTLGFKQVVSLSMRGRRGNIVQCYPAVELDYVPHDVSVAADQYLYIQFCGSDYNPANNPNDGEGWQYSTRANMVSLPGDSGNKGNGNNSPYGKRRNFPVTLDEVSILGDKVVARQLAFLGIDPLWANASCYNFQSDNSDSANNNITNCGKLNPSKACNRWLITNLKQGSWTYVNTRQNNFSNRAMKGLLNVGPARKNDDGLKIGLAVGGVVIGLAAVCAGAIFYAKKNPNSKLAQMMSRGKSTGTTI